MNKRGNILTENLIFIILNLVFIVIILLFLFSKMQDTSVLEERYAKQIAMSIDAAKPIMFIYLDMTKGYSKLKGFDFGKSVSINNENNFVTVKLRDGSGYTYSFFNDLKVTAYPDSNREGYYVLTVGENE
jgi:hypothetical protein